MLQREVARHLAARPGDMSRLSVEVQLVEADVELLFEVGPRSFLPAPEVASAVDPAASLSPRGCRPCRASGASSTPSRPNSGTARKQLHNALGKLAGRGQRADRGRA